MGYGMGFGIWDWDGIMTNGMELDGMDLGFSHSHQYGRQVYTRILSEIRGLSV